MKGRNPATLCNVQVFSPLHSASGSRCGLMVSIEQVPTCTCGPVQSAFHRVQFAQIAISSSQSIKVEERVLRCFVEVYSFVLPCLIAEDMTECILGKLKVNMGHVSGLVVKSPMKTHVLGCLACLAVLSLASDSGLLLVQTWGCSQVMVSAVECFLPTGRPRCEFLTPGSGQDCCC